MESATKQEGKKRVLIIPHKRPLLPISTTTSSSSSSTSLQQHLKPDKMAGTKIQRTINPSALPAEIQLRRPVFSSLKSMGEEEGVKESQQSLNIDDGNSDNKVVRIEFDSSEAPQPFLEPELLHKIMEERQKKPRIAKEKQEVNKEEEEEEEMEDSLAAQQSTEQEVRRRAVQADYGSMAIRDRMTVSGRGRRRR